MVVCPYQRCTCGFNPFNEFRCLRYQLHHVCHLSIILEHGSEFYSTSWMIFSTTRKSIVHERGLFTQPLVACSVLTWAGSFSSLCMSASIDKALKADSIC